MGPRGARHSSCSSLSCPCLLGTDCSPDRTPWVSQLWFLPSSCVHFAGKDSRKIGKQEIISTHDHFFEGNKLRGEKEKHNKEIGEGLCGRVMFPLRPKGCGGQKAGQGCGWDSETGVPDRGDGTGLEVGMCWLHQRAESAQGQGCETGRSSSHRPSGAIGGSVGCILSAMRSHRTVKAGENMTFVF